MCLTRIDGDQLLTSCNQYTQFLRVSGKNIAEQTPNGISAKQLREKYENDHDILRFKEPRVVIIIFVVS